MTIHLRRGAVRASGNVPGGYGRARRGNSAQAAIDARDQERFRDLYCRPLEHIRQTGTPLATDDLRGSELMLPPPDTSLAEVAREFHGHGLIPE